MTSLTRYYDVTTPSTMTSQIMEYLCERFQLKHERDLRSSPTAMAKLRREAEKAKRLLSTETQVLCRGTRGLEPGYEGIRAGVRGD